MGWAHNLSGVLIKRGNLDTGTQGEYHANMKTEIYNTSQGTPKTVS